MYIYIYMYTHIIPCGPRGLFRSCSSEMTCAMTWFRPAAFTRSAFVSTTFKKRKQTLQTLTEH